ncbi:hypothetical protein HK102_007334, partial [Quaeritorhiza haematococci]
PGLLLMEREMLGSSKIRDHPPIRDPGGPAVSIMLRRVWEAATDSCAVERIPEITLSDYGQQNGRQRNDHESTDLSHDCITGDIGDAAVQAGELEAAGAFREM